MKLLFLFVLMTAIVLAAHPGGEGCDDQNGEDGDERCSPGEVRERRSCCEHHAGGDGHPCEGCAGGCGAELVGDETEECAQAECPDGDLWGVRQPPAGFEDDVCTDGWEDEEQDGFGLPLEVSAGHEFIVAVDPGPQMRGPVGTRRELRSGENGAPALWLG